MPELTPRQEEILHAAVALIAEGGIGRLTIKNLARRVRVTEPAVYRHFAGKGAIVAGVLDLFARGTAAHMAALEAQPPSLEGVLTFIAGRLEDFSERPAFAAVVFAEDHFRGDRRLNERVAAVMNTHRDFFTRYISAAQRAGRIRADLPAPQIFRMVFGAFRLLVKQWRLAPDGGDLRAEGRGLLKALRTVLKGGQPCSAP